MAVPLMAAGLLATVSAAPAEAAAPYQLQLCSQGPWTNALVSGPDGSYSTRGVPSYNCGWFSLPSGMLTISFMAGSTYVGSFWVSGSDGACAVVYGNWHGGFYRC
ncbi:hypothetical protein [Micromonospora sp. NPDC051141]|uniref:hypothetical protein n=1 Tax=Micromonospora sp. NPDC051141 TaxID=3364284 RepID=UPI0037B30BFE